MKHIDREVQTTLCAISTTSSLVNKTGSWRFATPAFVDRVSPCHRECPAGEDIPGYMYLAAQGKTEEAWRLIVRDNPFPATMGRVCYHSCEKKCNRLEHDEPVSIHSVERFIGDYGLEKNLKFEIASHDVGKEVAVAGAGPAGLTAACYLRLMGYGVSIFDREKLPGGLLRYGIPSYRLPKAIVDGEINRILQIGVRLNMGVGVGKDLSWNEIENRFDAVFLSIGASKGIELKIKGENLEGVYNALEFLRDVSHGLIPDMGNEIVVVGGGNSAIDCARVSRRLGAKVTVIYRRSEEEMPAHREEFEMAVEEGVSFVFLSSPGEILGNGRVRGIRVLRMTLGELDGSGRRRPVPSGGAFDIKCQSVIFALGESLRIEDLPASTLFGDNSVITDSTGQTSNPKFFAGGDIIEIPHTVTHAIGSGRRAALAINKFLCKGESGTEKSIFYPSPLAGVHKIDESASSDYLNTFYFDKRLRLAGHILSPEQRAVSFEEVTGTLSKGEAEYEARRCFICGSCTECGNCYIFCPENSVRKEKDGYGYIIDMDYCKGCGICVKECPRGAMKMEFME